MPQMLAHRRDAYNPHAKLYVGFRPQIEEGKYVVAAQVRTQIRDDLLSTLDTMADVLALSTSCMQEPPVINE